MEERQHRLLGLLAAEADYQPLQYFAEHLRVSERTIRSDIVALNLLSKGRYAIESKRGIGVKLLNQAQLLEQREVEVKANMSVEQRRFAILADILVWNQRVSINQLAEKYHVGRSSIQNDLKWLRETFPTIQIKSGKAGTEFSGSGTDLMEALMVFNTYVVSHQLSAEGQALNFKQQKQLLNDYYDEAVVNACYDAVLALVQKDANLLAEYNAYNIFNAVLALVSCRYLGLGLADKELLVSAEETPPGHPIAESLLKQISEQVTLTYGISDSQLLAKYLISNRLVTLETPDINLTIVDQIIEKLNLVFDVQPAADPVFDEQVHKHVTLMVFRLQNEIAYRNPFVQDIKDKWSLGFNMIWLVLKEFEEVLKITFSEHEIGFLVVYYQPYIDVSNASRILIICQHGVAATQLISNKLRNNLPSTVSISSTSSLKVTDQLLAQYDFIVSTVQFETQSPKVIYVASLIDDHFLTDIRFKMTQPTVDSELFLESLTSLKQVLQPDFIFLNKRFKNKADLLTFARYALTSSGYVSDAYMDSVQKRELQGSTELSGGVAIPHGNPVEVKQSVVFMTTLDEALEWHKGRVRLVFLICIAQRDERLLKGIMSDIYSLVQHEGAIDFILTSQDKHKLFQTLGAKILPETKL